MNFGVRKIISGGQTGADRAALDAARALGLEYGGSIPKGRRSEDGQIPDIYTGLIELGSRKYEKRTRRNVKDADATVIFTIGPLSGGSFLTYECAEALGRPVLHLDLGSMNDSEAADTLEIWLARTQPAVLNVAGSRASGAPGIYGRVRRIIENAGRGSE